MKKQNEAMKHYRKTIQRKGLYFIGHRLRIVDSAMILNIISPHFSLFMIGSRKCLRSTTNSLTDHYSYKTDVAEEILETGKVIERTVKDLTIRRSCPAVTIQAKLKCLIKNECFSMNNNFGHHKKLLFLLSV